MKVNLLIPLLHRARYRNRKLREELAAERAINSQLNTVLDEALEVVASQSKELEASQALAKDQSALLAGFEQLIQTQVKPLCAEVIAMTSSPWARGEQHRFSMEVEE